MMKSTEPGTRGGPPDPIDIHVGQRIRLRRQILKMSQETLAHELGVSFQQQQKRESGANRVSASALLKTARILGVGPEFFFDGLTSDQGKIGHDPLQTNIAMRLVRAHGRMDAVAGEMMINFIERLTTRHEDVRQTEAAQ